MPSSSNNPLSFKHNCTTARSSLHAFWELQLSFIPVLGSPGSLGEDQPWSFPPSRASSHCRKTFQFTRSQTMQGPAWWWWAPLAGRGKPAVTGSCKDSPCVQSSGFKIQKSWKWLLFNLQRSNYTEQSVPGAGGFPQICVMGLLFSGFSDD